MKNRTGDASDQNNSFLGWKSTRRQLILAIAAVLSFSFIVNIFILAIPIYSLQIFDRVTVSQSRETLAMLFIAVSICVFTMFGFEILRRKTLFFMAESISINLTRFSLDQQGKKHIQENSLTINNTITDHRHSYFDFTTINRMTTNLHSKSILSLIDAAISPLFLALLFILHPAFGVTVALINSLLVVICGYQFSRIRGTELYSQAISSSKISWLKSEYASQLVRGNHHHLVDNINREILNQQEPQSTDRKSLDRLTACILLIRNYGQVAVPTVGAALLIQQQITPGVMLAAMILSMKGLIPWEQVFHNSQSLHELYRDFITLRTAAQKNIGNLEAKHTPIKPLSGAISISVNRQNNHQTIALSPGSLTAIVGPSGSGKSSVLKSLIGLPHNTNLDLTVQYDSHNIELLDRENLTEKLIYVPLASTIPDLSVRDFIAEDSPIDPDHLYEVSVLLGLHARLLQLPLGYDSIISEHAITRSSGVFHLLLLVRAIAKRPKFLFIDNLDAILDKHGVEHFEKMLYWLKENSVTTVITTQRKSLLGYCDSVLLTDKGNVFEFSQKETSTDESALSAQK
jgi:ATP-binding cassette, subfamily C, type I secretion system permease/ATPase